MRKVVAALLVLALPALATNADWERVKTLRSGEKIWLEHMRENRLQSVKADMVVWTEDALTVRIKKRDTTLARSDIRKIAVYAGKSRARVAGIGTLISAGIGLGLMGFSVTANQDDADVPAAAMLGGGGLLFGGVGGRNRCGCRPYEDGDRP
jgi:hypothetical protein